VTLGAIVFTLMIPVTMLVPALKQLIDIQFNAGPFWTHSFMSINMIGAIVASPLIASLADHGGRRKRVIGWALLLDAACLCSMSLMPSLAGVLAVRFLEGAAHILALTTLMALAASCAEPNRRGRMMGVIGASMMCGTACGTRLGGFVWQMTGHWMFVFAGLISALAAAAVLAFVVEPTSGKSGRSSVSEALSLVRREPRLLVPYAYSFADRLCVGVVITTLVLFFAEIHDQKPGEISRLLFLFLGPFALLIYPAGRLVDRIGTSLPICAGTLAFGVVFALYGLIPIDGLWIAMLASGVLSALMFAPNLALCAELSSVERRGTAYAGFNAAGSLGMLLGPLMGGGVFILASRFSGSPTAYQVTFIVTGAVEVLCALITLPFLLRLRREGTIR
jgi:MFS family permease